MLYKKKEKEKTVKIPIILSVTISIVAIFLIFYFTFDAEAFQNLRHREIKYEFLFLAILLQVIYWLLWSKRLQILTNAIDKKVKISFKKSLKIVLANLFLGCITPSMAGGEPVRIYLLKKEGMNTGRATGAVVGERLLDGIVVLSLVPIAFIVFRAYLNTGILSTALTVGVALFLIIFLLFIYALKKPEKVKSLLIVINNKIRRFYKSKKKESTIIKRINREVDNFHDGMICFISEEKKAFFSAGFFTFFFWSSGFMIPSMILLGLGLPPFFVESFAAQILLLIIVMMPITPGSTGIAEVSVFGLYGVLIGTGDGSLIFIFILLFRFVTYYLPLLVGVVFQHHMFKSVLSFSIDKIKNVDKNIENKS